MGKDCLQGPATLTDVLRRVIIDSGLATQALAKATGVERMSIARFVRGERSLRLDMADRLSAYFGLELRPAKRRKDT
jgi:plasmid maintenance system antidote protein VapI